MLMSALGRKRKCSQWADDVRFPPHNAPLNFRRKPIFGLQAPVLFNRPELHSPALAARDKLPNLTRAGRRDWLCAGNACKWLFPLLNLGINDHAIIQIIQQAEPPSRTRSVRCTSGG